MKPTDRFLQRLLDAAAHAPPEPATVPPFGLETRILAQWRGAAAEDDTVSLFAFFRRAMFGASLVLVLCATWCFSRPTGSPIGDEAAVLDYDIQMSLSP